MTRLRQAGVNPTMQRLAIYACLEVSSDHPTAEEVYERVHDLYPTIARATVYNTLDLLSQAGAILRLSIDPSASRYDADLGPHIHFRCRRCERIIDLEESWHTYRERVEGHRVESVRTYAYGVCSACLAEADGATRGAGSTEAKRGGDDA